MACQAMEDFSVAGESAFDFPGVLPPIFLGAIPATPG